MIQIFEDEYIEHKDIVLDRIRDIFDYNNLKPKVYASECDIREIGASEAKKFLDKNDTQGYKKSKVFLGMYYNGTLVSVAGFNIENENKDIWMLSRYSTDIHKCCVGFMMKTFQYFVCRFNPSEVIILSDRRWNFSDSVEYSKLGFELKDIIYPDYMYIKNSDYKRHYKFNYTKQILCKKYGFSKEMTIDDMCDKIGVYKIWDCGLLKYVWKKETV